MKTAIADKKCICAKRQDLTRDISLIYIVIFALMMILPAQLVQADAKQASISAEDPISFPDLITVGHGELTWFGLSIYRASLWTVNGKFENLQNSIPVAMTISYQKNISSDSLVDRTLEEWERLGIYETEQRNYWSQQLRKIWPDVSPGDSITTLVTSDKSTRFYYNDTLLTVLQDPTLGTALLSIWLDPRTSEPDLRAKLIGRQES